MGVDQIKTANASNGASASAADLSSADQAFLSPTGQERIRRLKEQYAAAIAAGDHAAAGKAHEQAEAIRKTAGYSGGEDGGGYADIITPNVFRKETEVSVPQADTDSIQSLVGSLKDTAEQQINTSVDYATRNAVEDLQRSQENAKEIYQNQRNQVAEKEANDLSNSTLYAAARGDRGGIGQTQYNSIQNTAAQNQLAINQTQVKLATDTARQIADLRARGEYEKADAKLKLTQTYLTQLIQFKQWAASYDLSGEELRERIREWNQNFIYQQERDAVSDSMWSQDFDYRQRRDEVTDTWTEKNFLASVANLFLKMGVPLTDSQKAALEADNSQINRYVSQIQASLAEKP